ncbi:MAG: hypothetical protein M1814_006319 [Vezdaea aestivalis]|nr:MAG: hypothetical protein M1814_006319 [Vezdaea aestivalis]
MASPSPTGWAQLRQQARALETQTESLFNSYSQYTTQQTPTPEPSVEETALDNQLSTLLSQRAQLLTQLSALLASDTILTSSALKQTHLSSHRDTLAEHRAEHARLRSKLTAARERSNLLSSVRQDISAYRAAEADEADYMVSERARLERSHGVVDGVLSQAYAVREGFVSQGEMLSSVNRRIVGAASQVPGINGLIGRIGAKKRRDGIILGVFLAFCILVLLFFR